MTYTRALLALAAVACTESTLLPGDAADPEGPRLSPLAPLEDSGSAEAPPEPAEEPDPDPATTTPTAPTTPGDCWWEPMDPDVDVDDVRAAFRASGARADALEVMDRRWPAGSALLREMAHDPYIDVFLETSSWSAMMDSLMTVVHEETHGWDYAHSVNPTRFSYFFTDDLRLDTRWIDGFPRSRIRGRVETDATDLYADLYLVGTQGTYGFVELVDETTCYVNGLGGAIAGWDAIPWQMSASDGPLAFLYFLALYLEEAEDADPALYRDLQDDARVREVLRSLWLRTHFFLQYSDPVPELGIEDDRIRELLYDHQGTWEDFLGHPLAAGPCLP